MGQKRVNVLGAWKKNILEQSCNAIFYFVAFENDKVSRIDFLNFFYSNF